MNLKDKKNKIKVGFTAGDMNGIGPEILLSSLANSEMLSLFIPIIYAPIKNLIYTSNHFDLNITFNNISSPEESIEGAINVIDNHRTAPSISFGILDKEMGVVAFESIKNSVKDLKNEKIDVLVTPPINKQAIHSDKFRFMGHTDYIASEIDGNPTMMMVSKNLRVALLTEHTAIADVTKAITSELVETKVKTLHSTLMKDFRIEKPKIAILSLDPHAGDGGVISTNDKKIISPAVKKIHNSGILIYGPFAADSFFGSMEYKKYDLIVACYHDQGLIPFKTLDLNESTG